MGSISISSASLTKPSRDSVNLNSATVSYRCSATINRSANTSWSGGLYYQTKTSYNYSSLSYSWSFSPAGSASGASGTTTVTGLTQGNENSVSGRVTASCVETVTHHSRTCSPIYDNEGNKIGVSSWTESSYNTTNNLQASLSTSAIKVYTKPGSFTEYNFSKEQTIESPEGLTATKVSRWVEHCNKCAHWYNQNNTDTANNCKVSSGEVISAAWYNRCVAAIPNNKPATVTGGLNGTIITADIINALGRAISIS